VREQSWAVNVEERYVGVAGVAAPVADAAGRTIAAIGVQGPSGRIDVTPESQLVIAVRDAANGLTGRLVAERFG
jgi:DNA-binding IclR family transcriptional regulator